MADREEVETETPTTAPATRPRPRVLHFAAILVVAALALAPLWLSRGRPRELVFVFVLDALRADHLSQYGYARDTSPGLDPLARVSTLFQRVYAPSSYTTASTASLFTGKAPLRHGASRQGAKLRGLHETLAEVLAAGGYTARGVSFNPVIAHSTGFTQGFADFVEREPGSPFNLYPDVGQGLERILGWLDEHPDESQLLYFQVMNTHGPYLVPESASAALLGRPPRPEFQYYRPPMGEILAGEVAKRALVTPEYVESGIERYDTAIRHTTDQLGLFFDELERRGLFDDALIVVTADHGDEFFEHGGFSHGYTLYEEVVRVPLLVKLPGQRKDRRISRRVTLMDVLPTLAEAAGVPAPAGLDGKSLLPALRPELPDTAATESPLFFRVDFAPRLVGGGIVDGRHKLIAIEANYEGAEQVMRLYDLEADPREQVDLAAREPELARELLGRLLHETRSQRETAAAPAAIATDLDRERLRALGYVE
jgi:arylsulfatase A-like enzyme